MNTLALLAVWSPMLLASGLEAAAAENPPAVVGRPAPRWSVRDWMNSPPLTLEDLKGKVVLVRWWTGPDCPYCIPSVRALSELDRRFRDRGLVVVGFYHHKSGRPLRLEEVRRAAGAMGMSFPIAVDPGWRTLRRYWLDRMPGELWTSVSFLIDRRGMVRYVHPGGTITAADAAGLEKRIESLLREGTGTFSIVARDRETGDLGVAVASKVLAVGAIVPYAEADVGAVATQALANPAYGPEGLSRMRSGLGPREALESLLSKDEGRDHRQAAFVDAKGRAYAYTGRRCFGWAGHREAQGCSVQGNLLASGRVLKAMVRSYGAARGDLAERLLAALEAGEAAGGDRRGRQSAALLVVRKGGGYLGLTDRYIDLRVDDHPEPVQELRRLLGKFREQFGDRPGSPPKTVFLMHGIVNVGLSMKRFERALELRGFKVVNLDYPSRSRTIEEHSRWLGERVRAEGEGDLYFIGHSLGSIVIRHYLASERPPRAVRFVMVAPPNHGSAVAEALGDLPLFRLVWGSKAGQELRSGRRDFWEKFPPPPIEFGILAGGKGDGRGFNPGIPDDDDGTVSVEETRLTGAKDFKLLPYLHTSILFRKRTVQEAVRFLETGRF